MRLLPCPDPNCRGPAEVLDRTTLWSTCGPIEHVKTQCVHRHVFFMPAPAPHPSAMASRRGSGAATAKAGLRGGLGEAGEQSPKRPDD